MRYENIEYGVFLSRPNRFIALVDIAGRTERVHVKNTGRCRELLEAGNRVILQKGSGGSRKTAYDLIAVWRKDGKLINMDSTAPNEMAYEWLRAGGMGELTDIRREVTIGSSRFDLTAQRNGQRVIVEVKGCTLEEGGVARFPDAPTQRGVKHVRELIRLAGEGDHCAVLIVVQMNEVDIFRPNWRTHPEFGQALLDARAAGVEIRAVRCLVEPGDVRIEGGIPVCLESESE